MEIGQLIWNQGAWKKHAQSSVEKPNLIIFFSGKELLKSGAPYLALQNKYPDANILGCSTAGEIIDDEVIEEGAVATTISFHKTEVLLKCLKIENSRQSFDVGKKLSDQFPEDDLKHLFILSDGQLVNGTRLIEGIKSGIANHVGVTGGLAGDGDRFEETLVACNAPPRAGIVAALGFYGDHIKIANGSAGGWDTFGPNRIITRSDGNILYELDHKPALDLYKKYLGSEAENLPSSALLFPLKISENEDDHSAGTVRTILSVDEQNKSMTFAGEMPVGYNAQLMMANFDRLIDGATDAAKIALNTMIKEEKNQQLALLISCVGRKLVLGPKIEEEVETVNEIFGKQTKQLGFYSYGEISPHHTTGKCELHNQTMTITLISEEDA
ncbi:MAG: FIST N-terminal domain-containing protein [Bacteroidota bacterium]